jgi:MFS family permease
MSAETTPDPGVATAQPATPQPLGALAILRHRGFLVLYLNAAAVFLGVMGQAIARSWLAFELTGSNAALGGVLLSFGIALLIATPWGGVAADRLPKRLVLQLSVLILATSSAWIGLAVVFDVIQYWMLLGAGVLQAVGFALFNPARMAFLSELVPRGSMLAFQTTNQSQLIALSDMEYHGRVQSLIMLSFGAFGIAALPLGLLADVIGLRWTLTGMGVGVLLFVLLYVLVSRRRVGSAQRLRDLG